LQSDIELVIRDLLLAYKDSKIVAQKIIERLKTEKMNRNDRKAFVAFLINHGFYNEAYTLFADWFTEKKRVPLRHFVFALHRSGFRPGRDFLRYLFEAQNELEEKDRIRTFAPWEEFSSQLAQMRNDLVRDLEERLVRRRREHFEKLEFLREQRMIKEEERLLIKLSERYPDDGEIIRLQQEFKERWARHLLAEKALEAVQKDIFERRHTLTPEQIQWADQFSELMEECLVDHPRQAYNFSLGLHFMELYEHALILLRHAGRDTATLWFRLELLLKARRYIECLDDIANIENELSNNPETTFASTYLRAQVLKGLGQTGKALELLKSIVAIRPHYRSAHSLLLEWSAGSTI
jgi:hypothetical protein